jgi:hypothetical protein
MKTNKHWKLGRSFDGGWGKEIWFQRMRFQEKEVEEEWPLDGDVSGNFSGGV